MEAAHHPHYIDRRFLQFNVGFMLAEGVGYRRAIEVDLPHIRLDDDLELDSLSGLVRFSRNTRGILATVRLETGIVGECARCLRPTLVPVTLEFEELFVFPPSPESPFSVAESGILDLAPLVREEALLSVPMMVLCRPDCAGLCAQCGQDLNEGACDCERDTIDPRFEVLRLHLQQLDERAGD